MAYYRNSSSGCGELLVAIVLVITVGTLLVKGCVSLVSSIDFDGDWNRKPVKTDNHVWGEHGVDPVLRTSRVLSTKIRHIPIIILILRCGVLHVMV